jgi:hypothetical protein
MPKTFLDFAKTGYLSAANFIGYQGNQEFSISFESLAAVVYNYIEQLKIKTPILYRFQPTSSILINNLNKTYGIYLSSSVQELDLQLGEEWMTLTKAGNCYDLTTSSLVLSTDKSTLCLGDWITIKNTALSSTTTLFFQQTGSAVLTVEEGEGPPSGLANNKIVEALRDPKVNLEKIADRIKELAKELTDIMRENIDFMLPPLASGYNSENPTEEEIKQCDQWNTRLNRIFDSGVHWANLNLSMSEYPENVLSFAKTFIENYEVVEREMNTYVGGEDPCGIPVGGDGYNTDLTEIKEELRKYADGVDQNNRGLTLPPELILD